MSETEHEAVYHFLYKISGEINKLYDTEEVLQCIVKRLHNYTQSDAASIIWLETDGTQVFRAVAGPHTGNILGLRIPKGEGISGWVAESGECLWIPDVSEDSRFFAGVDVSSDFHTRSIYAAPIMKSKQIIAVLEVVNLPTQFNKEEARFLIEELTSMIVEVLERNEFFAEALRFGNAFEAYGEPSMLIGQDGILLDINRAARELLPVQNDFSKVHFDELSVASMPFSDMVTRIYNRETISWNFVIGEETQRTFLAMLVPVQVADTTIYLWQANDITDSVVVEDARLQLFSMLVHDLRVPLGSMHHSIELLMTAWHENDSTIPVDQILEIAMRSEHRMERLISDILDTTRLNTQEKTLAVTNIDIAGLVRDVVNVVASSADRRKHTLDTRVQSNLQSLRGDLDLLQRVLINILGNAIKYTPEGGEILLAVYDDVANVYFEISDNGPGILPSDTEYIFDLFFRGKTSRVKGAGIGLAFSKLAVEAHGGKIWLDREVERGSKFVFYVPKELPEGAVFYEEY